VSLSAERSQRQDPAADALAWLRDALWAPDADVRYDPVAADDPAGRWLPRPATGAPELLVPLGARRASGAVARRFWDGMPARRRARQWLGEALLRSGLAERRWPGRVALTGADADLHDPERSLVAALADRLDTGPLLVAATLRPQAFNGKPILQLFRSDGEPLAFAKVAVDDLTAEYVATEADWLRRTTALRPPARAPRLLAMIDWRGRPVAVLEPMALPRLPRRRPGWALDAVVDAVADLGDRRTIPAGESALIARCRDEAVDGPDDEFAALVELVLARHGDTVVEVGGWHGDLSPWNTATAGDRLLIWDWELAGDGLPVGADRLHHRVMTATHLHGADADQALGALVAEPVVLDLYLLELDRRDRRADRKGRPDPSRRLGDAAARHLRSGR
jgi:hypothetical protein